MENVNINPAKQSFTLTSQQEAVLSWAKNEIGSLNLIALAGTGKTSTIIELVSHISGSVFLGAFNKSIATELQLRIRNLETSANVTSATMHSAGLRTWKRNFPKTQVDADKVENIIFEYIKKNKETHLFTSREIEILSMNSNNLRRLISLAKQAGIGISEVGEINNLDLWLNVFDHYGQEDYFNIEENELPFLFGRAIDILKLSISSSSEFLDFDDMIYMPLFMKQQPETYDWVLLDEAQDINICRRILAIRMMNPKTGRLVAVGDPKQAIYGFTGADANSMKNIRDKLNSKELFLSKTFRCGREIVSYVNDLVPELEAAESNSDGIVRGVELVRPNYPEPIDFDPCHLFIDEVLTKSDVILCRKNAPLVRMAYSLIRRDIGCRIEGRDIGQGLTILIKRFKENNLFSLEETLKEFSSKELSKSKYQKSASKKETFLDKMETIYVLIDICLDRNQERTQDLLNLIYKLFEDSKPGSKPRLLTLSTVHKAKGREWDRVYILGKNAYMPSPYAKQEWEKEQENNLIYVAMTRAKNELVFINVPV